MTAVSLSLLALARWDWMTADEIVASCALLILLVVAIWGHLRSKKRKRNHPRISRISLAPFGAPARGAGSNYGARLLGGKGTLLSAVLTSTSLTRYDAKG